jgi:beta-N-acetylhexosaminidase
MKNQLKSVGIEINLNENPFYLNEKEQKWVYETLESMSLEEKAGQLFCVNFKEGKEEEIEYVYDILKPGACMYRTIPLENAVNFTDKVAERTKIPLLIAANLEKGGNGIVTEGTLFASPMEVAATGNVEMAQKLAEVCAKEGKAVGANWAFAPIIDIDRNFRNPITNTRTFGSNPEIVEKMGVSYVKTIQNYGMAASIKHFPGDGQDERDQHLVTSINDLSCEEWDKTYGKVYEACIKAGALTCMIGHILQPAYTRFLNPEIKDEDILPGSLSKELMTDLLRDKLGFNGLIITDATTMAGYTLVMPRSLAVPTSIAAGADMFLFARNLKEDYQFMLEGINNGIITEERLNAAVIRILATKAALKLYQGKETLSLSKAKQVVGCSEHKEWAKACADQAITLVKEEKGVLPITTEKYKKILFYPIESAGGFTQYSVKAGVCENLMERLRDLGFEVDAFIPPTGNEGRTPPTTEITKNYDLIIYVANLATKSNQTAVRIEWAQPMGANCMHYLHEVPTIFISVENPYHLLDVPRVKTYINTYSSNDQVLEELINKLKGESAFKGKSPIDPFCGKWDAHLN